MYPDYSLPYFNLALEDCSHESREDSCTEERRDKGPYAIFCSCYHIHDREVLNCLPSHMIVQYILRRKENSVIWGIFQTMPGKICWWSLESWVSDGLLHKIITSHCYHFWHLWSQGLRQDIFWLSEIYQRCENFFPSVRTTPAELNVLISYGLYQSKIVFGWLDQLPWRMVILLLHENRVTLATYLLNKIWNCKAVS